jgi:hypothetical protein
VAAMDHRYGTLVYVSAYLGSRWEKVSALKPRDLELAGPIGHRPRPRDLAAVGRPDQLPPLRQDGLGSSVAQGSGVPASGIEVSPCRPLERELGLPGPSGRVPAGRQFPHALLDPPRLKSAASPLVRMSSPFMSSVTPPQRS